MMKKILIATLCATALTLTACDKKAADTAAATPAVQLSSNNTADIKTDMATFETFTTAKAKEAVDFQTKAAQAAQTGDKKAAEAVVGEMEKFFADYNKGLDELAVKSTEVDSLRQNSKKMMTLTVDMLKQSTSEKPDTQKIMDIQKEMSEVQKTLLDEQQAIKQKIAG